MATSKKIVDTRKLAAKGRGSDTLIRKMDDKPAHVNAYEAYLIDNLGEKGKKMVKEIGSGNINPRTGLKEYDWRWTDPLNLHHNPKVKIGGWVGESWDQIIGKEGVLGNIGDIVTGEKNIGQGLSAIGQDIKDVWDYTLGVKGLGDAFNVGDKERALESQARGTIAGGLENLQTQYGQYMGDEGFIEREQDIREKGLKSTYDIAMGGYDLAGKKLSESTGASYKQLGDVSNVQRSRSNLAYSGTIEEKVEEGKRAIGKQYDLGREGIKLGRTGTQSTYDIGMETSALGAEKSEAEFMAGLRKQMNVMMTDYLSATGEAYGDTGAGSMWEELNTLFDTYSSNV